MCTVYLEFYGHLTFISRNFSWITRPRYIFGSLVLSLVVITSLKLLKNLLPFTDLDLSSLNRVSLSIVDPKSSPPSIVIHSETGRAETLPGHETSVFHDVSHFPIFSSLTDFQI